MSQQRNEDFLPLDSSTSRLTAGNDHPTIGNNEEEEVEQNIHFNQFQTFHNRLFFLTFYENFIFSFLYEIYLMYHIKFNNSTNNLQNSLQEDNFLKRFKNNIFKFFNFVFFKTKGIFSLFFLIIFYVQFYSIYLNDKLPWSLQSIIYFKYLSKFRTLQIFSNEMLNLYIPFLFACFFTIFFTVITIICLFVHYKCNYKIAKIRNDNIFNENKFINYLKNRHQLKNIKFYLFFILFQFIKILPILFIPIITIFMSSIKSMNIILIFTGFLLFIPFITLSLFFLTFIYEWRFDTNNLMAKSHTRLDFLLFYIISLIVCFHTLFEDYSLIIFFFDFVDFILILIIIACFIFFMSFYKNATNIVNNSFLLGSVFVIMISTLMTVFKTFVPSMKHASQSIPELSIIACLFLSMIGGNWILKFRITLLEILVSEESRILYFLYHHRNDVIVPKGEFEVEMSIRTIGWVSNFIESKVVGRPQVASQDELRLRLSEMMQIDRVDEMFKNSIDNCHMSSPFVILSYAQFLRYCKEDKIRADDFIHMIYRYANWKWFDVRYMFYLKTRCWFEEDLLESINSESNN
ncbi:hypothetical protein ABK040_009766 [Willaertia magna]